MGTTHKSHSVSVKVFFLEHLLYCELQGGAERAVASCLPIPEWNTPRWFTLQSAQEPQSLLPGRPSHPDGPRCREGRGCCPGQNPWNHGSSLEFKEEPGGVVGDVPGSMVALSTCVKQALGPAAPWTVEAPGQEI